MYPFQMFRSRFNLTQRSLTDEQTMSMYLSCFVHVGIEEISVDLFEGIKKAEEQEEDVTVDEIVKQKKILVKTDSVLSIERNEESAGVLEFIKVRKVRT